MSKRTICDVCNTQSDPYSSSENKQPYSTFNYKFHIWHKPHGATTYDICPECAVKIYKLIKSKDIPIVKEGNYND